MNRKGVVFHHDDARPHISLVTLGKNWESLAGKFWCIHHIAQTLPRPTTICFCLWRTLSWLQKRLVKITWFSFLPRNLRSSTVTDLWFYQKSGKRSSIETAHTHWLVFKIYINKFALKNMKKPEITFSPTQYNFDSCKRLVICLHWNIRTKSNLTSW